MKTYAVGLGDSPAVIAAKHGVGVGALFDANRHKPISVVRGVQTWSTIGVGERINIPAGLGDAATASVAIMALIAAGGPCLKQNANIVCAVQAALGLPSDGKWGSDTSAAARRVVPNAPAACVGPPLWWGKKTDNQCTGIPVSFPTPVASPIQLPSLPSLPIPVASPMPAAPSIPPAIAAFNGVNPCLQSNASLVCAVQASLGLTPDGKYGNDTAAAVRRFLPGAPGGCSPAPLWWGKKTDNQCKGAPVVLPAPAPSPVFTPSPVVSIPSPIPSFPAPVTSLPIPSPIQPLPSPAPISVTPAPTPSNPFPAPVATAPQPIVTAPSQDGSKKLSTGTMVGIGVGAVAIIGLLVVASGKKSVSRTSTTTVRRAPSRRKPSRRKK